MNMNKGWQADAKHLVEVLVKAGSSWHHLETFQ